MADAVGEMLIDDGQAWFALRNLRPVHAKVSAYDELKKFNVRCYTPVGYRLVVVGGKSVCQEMPLIPDLLFAKSTRKQLDEIIEKIPKLQYRYKIGARRTPITVRSIDMERFISAVEAADTPRFYAPDEVTPAMRSRKIRIIGGRLDGCVGTLITTRGSKAKRLLIELPNLLAASVEVEADYIQLVD